MKAWESKIHELHPVFVDWIKNEKHFASYPNEGDWMLIFEFLEYWEHLVLKGTQPAVAPEIPAAPDE